MESNEVLDQLPRHLMSLVIDQPYNDYTAQDHAIWRYVMRRNVKYLPQVAHGSYLDGLKRTGVSIDRIPHMYGINRYCCPAYLFQDAVHTVHVWNAINAYTCAFQPIEVRKSDRSHVVP